MIGTLINIITVLLGGSLGLILGARFPERVKRTIVAGLGIFTAAFGIKMFLETQNAIIVLISLLLGALLGEWWKIEDGLQHFGRLLEKYSKNSHTGDNRFVLGFLTASLVFCTGPMTILGSIQDGLTGDYHLLAIKSVLDGIAALAFASTLGIGVLFSVIVILTYQGGITMLAIQLSSLLNQSMLNEMAAVGGILLLGIAISSLLEIKPIRVGNFLPALITAPLIIWIVETIQRTLGGN